MQTKIKPEYKANPEIAELDGILKSCVHCGFCNATCPTYTILGSELDGPRGRIYLVKGMLEGKGGEKTRIHLDRCLGCRSCETTCPSGVKYGRLVDRARNLLERPFAERLKNRMLLFLLPEKKRFSLVMKLARLLKPFLPLHVSAKIFPERKAESFESARHERKMLLLEGCALPVASPQTNLSASRVLDELGIATVKAAGCCGAMHQHMGEIGAARERARRNIDAWWPDVESGTEAIVSTSSGCGLQVKEYGELLKDDPDYNEKAFRISLLTKDIAEVLEREDLSVFSGEGRKIAFHCPCTLQHGQKLSGLVESILLRCRHALTPIADPHLCCGAAGTYFLLQPGISGRLLEKKIAALEGGKPEIIATANVGCQMQIESGTGIPVKHWIELLDNERK